MSTSKIVRKTLEEAQGLPRAEIDFSEKNLLHLDDVSIVQFICCVSLPRNISWSTVPFSSSDAAAVDDAERDATHPRPQQDYRDPAGHGKPGKYGDPQPVQQLPRGGARLSLQHAQAAVRM